ncbi:MAG: acyl-CoA thioesterase [Pedosphaera sp.]|nr:acyl-CoA thioesterase [Pedosphaera sp.]
MDGGALALASADDDAAFCVRGGRAAATRLRLERGLARAEPPPDEGARRQGHDGQGRCLLPVHEWTIELFRLWRNGVVFAVGKGRHGIYAAPMQGEIFRHRHRVTYAECTVGNHIYYARYLDLLEAARGELFRAAGVPLLKLQEAGIIFPVVECHMEYKAPARYDDELVIEVRLTELGRIRLGFSYRVLRGETLLVRGMTQHVCTTLDEKPQRLPPECVEVLGRYLNSAEGER